MIEPQAALQDISVGCGQELQQGQIEFHQAILPPLLAGLYRLVTQQVVTLKAEGHRYELTTPFQVDGPRFRLQPNDVQQVYPPANLTGSYEESLPHVVFRLPTLPWCRTIDGSAATGDTVTTPWLALLSLYPEDLVSDGNPVAIRQMTLNDLLSPSQTNVLPPDIDKAQFTAAELAQPLLAIDIPSPVFNGITPSIDDLPFLAHARQVNTDGKEILGLTADGYFSVVIGNRLPKPGAENTALVVSLEGQQSRLRGGTAPPPASTFVRVAVLASWSYTSGPALGDFIEILQAIPANGGLDLLQMPHEAFTGTVTPAQAVAQEALEIGYVPLLNNTRAGEETTSWYRSPGVPEPTGADPFGPYALSDKAIRYDPGPMDGTTPGTGLFNVTYACAWQIGRLLALSDAGFARLLFAWRRALHRGHDRDQLVADLAGRLPSIARMQTPGGEPIRRLDAAPFALTDFWLNAGRLLAQADLPRIVRHENRSDALLPGVIPGHEMRAIAGSDDPLAELLQRILGEPEVTR